MPLLRLVPVIGLALLVANCANSSKVSGRGGGNKYGVAASPRVIPDGEPIPKGGGREMIGKPYVVGGRTYVPSEGRGYTREGWASWYGSAFHGRLTANGEVFDRESIAAAHPTLPLPSYVRVTNILNKRSMVVRVNDRGPYEASRVLDVSERVADALDFRRKGTARVRVEYVGRASTRGSDDAKLLATLRTDGAPAPVGSGRTMLADLREEPRLRPSTLPPIVDADDGPEADGTPAPTMRARSTRPESELPMQAPTVVASLAPTPPTRPGVVLETPRTTSRTVVEAVEAPQPRPVQPQAPHLAGIY